MRVSTDAILLYGYCFTDEDTLPWDSVIDDEPGEGEDEDWEDRYATAVGIKKPTGEYEQHKKQYERYWDEKSKAAKKSGCTVGYHCSDRCSMYYVAIASSEKKANRGYPVKVDSIEVRPEWNDLLADFCKKLAISVSKQKPRWWLCSYWG